MPQYYKVKKYHRVKKYHKVEKYHKCAKDADSIDETIESVLNQINSIDDASCGNNSQVNQVTCVKSEVAKRLIS